MNKYEIVNSTTEMTKLQYEVYQRGLRVSKYRVNTKINKK